MTLANQIQVILYGTSACHLCEEAEVVLRESGIKFSKIDIVDDDKLFDTRVQI